MKKIVFMAIALTATVFASCSNNEPGKKVEIKEQLVIKLAGVDVVPSTEMPSRATGAPGQTGQLKLNDGHIFVINNAGSVVQHIALDVTAATSPTGQVVTTPVSSDSRVYIIGNVPSTLTPGSISSYDQIKTTVVSISTAGQNDYTKALLANSDGEAKMVTAAADGSATVSIDLSPLYSRLELAQVKGGSNIVSFTVTGVFVDHYYSSFTLTGASSGPVWAQTSKTDFTGNIGDEGTWASTGSAGSAVAVPATGQSWVYHMAADDLPRFIVRVKDIVYTDSNGQQQTTSDTRYITVTGYSGNAPVKFERGKIYQVAAVQLDYDKTALVPNPSDVTMTVKANVVDWVPVVLTPTV